jgi:hypothetical protein
MMSSTSALGMLVSWICLTATVSPFVKLRAPLMMDDERRSLVRPTLSAQHTAPQSGAYGRPFQMLPCQSHHRVAVDDK